VPAGKLDGGLKKQAIERQKALKSAPVDSMQLSNRALLRNLSFKK